MIIRPRISCRRRLPLDRRHDDGRRLDHEIKGIQLESTLGRYMLYITRNPGLIGAVGSRMVESGINIANFHLGRLAAGGDAIAFLEIDSGQRRRTLQGLRRLTAAAGWIPTGRGRAWLRLPPAGLGHGSTVAETETIVDMAEALGIADTIAAITERSMRGLISAALDERVMMLGAGCRGSRPSPARFGCRLGRGLLDACRAAGMRSVLVSGGFDLIEVGAALG